MVLKRVLVNSNPAAGPQHPSQHQLHGHHRHNHYSVKDGAAAALKTLLAATHHQLPAEFVSRLHDVTFKGPTASSPCFDGVYFPTPLKEQEAAAAIKALEACAVAAIADLRFGAKTRKVEVDLTKSACFLISAYIATIDGMDKAHPEVKGKIPDTDLNRAQSILYRRLSANLYETSKPGEYYHIHGSLDASATLSMIGLPPFRPDLTDYHECLQTIETAVKQFTVEELENMNEKEGQAGCSVLKWDDFRATPHGRLLLSLPPFTTHVLEETTPTVPFGPTFTDPFAPSSSFSFSPTPAVPDLPQVLSGIRVLELCRVIAGPTIGRSLAAHGAHVLKVTSPNLPDVPFFQVDVNTGKHTTALHLQNPEDRAKFEALLATADVIIDGYRPGVVDRLGYGPTNLAAIATRRGRGFVYIAEDCFGGTGIPGAQTQTEWSGRPGWQQIADCVTGVAWEQGTFMGLEEPVVPPFPMSDYGTGGLGCLAALTGLYLRATKGGSWVCRTSLCQYDVFLQSLGLYPQEVQDRLRRTHDREFFELRHHDSVDEVGRRALKSVRHLHPELFADGVMNTAWSWGFNAEVRWPKEAVTVEGIRVGHVRATRPNGFDSPTWDGWEEDDSLLVQ